MGQWESLLLAMAAFHLLLAHGAACNNGTCKVGEACLSNADCQSTLFCLSCEASFDGSQCVRSTLLNHSYHKNYSLPFNKYSFLTTHNSFAIDDGVPRVAAVTNQEDNVTQQLNNGVRGLMLDTYDYEGDVWLCHSFGGKCHDYNKFVPAINTLREIEAFLSANPSEIVTVILEDYVNSSNGLTKVFTDAGLMKYWFPLSKMPKNGQDWPLVSDMVANNQRLIVFTSMESKESSEGIAYQWNYMVENEYGDEGTRSSRCYKRPESSALNDTSKSLFLVNYFMSVPDKASACVQNSRALVRMIQECSRDAGNRWPNFVATDFYKRNDGGASTFQATEMLNGELQCGCNDVRLCGAGYKNCKAP